jgi:hypothetical protein
VHQQIQQLQLQQVVEQRQQHQQQQEQVPHCCCSAGQLLLLQLLKHYRTAPALKAPAQAAVRCCCG